MQIEDGTNSGGGSASTSENRLNVSARANRRIFYVSRDHKNAFHFLSSYSATSGDCVVYIKNTSSSKRLYLSVLRCGGDNNAVWNIVHVNEGLTPTGTEPGAKNLALHGSGDGSYQMFGDAAVGGSIAGETIEKLRSLAGDDKEHDFHEAVYLSPGVAIAVIYTGTTGAIDVSVGGFFDK